jgi:hypothetical protein
MRRYRKAPDGMSGIALMRTLANRRWDPARWSPSRPFAILSPRALPGLHEQIGGSPDHIEIARSAAVPGESGSTSEALLHDAVPGGTGYQFELADPRAGGTCSTALGASRQCACWPSCGCRHRCLLPFAAP